MDFQKGKPGPSPEEEAYKELAYAVSHDLRGSLRHCLSFLELLERRHGETLPEKGRFYLERALVNARVMESRLSGLLRLSRLHGEVEKRRKLNVLGLLEDLREDWALVWEREEIEIFLPDKAFVVEGIYGHLRFLFQELLHNAGLHGERRPLRIWVERKEKVAGEPSLLFRDNGVGVEEEGRSQIFRPFFSRFGEDCLEHPGLGLTLCRRIMQLQGGNLEVEDHPEGGFCLALTFSGHQG